MNGPYHPVSTLSLVDQQILRLKKKLQRNKEQQNDPNWHKKRNETKKKRLVKKRIEDPQYFVKLNEKQRTRYKANPGPSIECSKKWNYAHKEQCNANKRKSYQKNKEKICARNRENRRLKRESKLL